MPDPSDTPKKAVGAPGKSRLLERLMRADIEKGKSFVLIDPHGSLYEKLVKWSRELKHENTGGNINQRKKGLRK